MHNKEHTGSMLQWKGTQAHPSKSTHRVVVGLKILIQPITPGDLETGCMQPSIITLELGCSTQLHVLLGPVVPEASVRKDQAEMQCPTAPCWAQ